MNDGFSMIVSQESFLLERSQLFSRPAIGAFVGIPDGILVAVSEAENTGDEEYYDDDGMGSGSGSASGSGRYSGQRIFVHA